MEKNLQKIFDFVAGKTTLSDNEKASVISILTTADKKISLDAFKVERLEHVKKTLSVLLEETIEELEQKRKAMEDKNRELEIEAALERVRTVAMGMLKPDDLTSICEIMFHELKTLGFRELRNTMIDIHYDEKAYLLNYDYSETSGKTVTRFNYNLHPIVDNMINHARQSNEVFTEMTYTGKALQEWRDFRKKNGEADDKRLDDKDALYYYFYSIGAGAIGISGFSPAGTEQLNLLKRFRNVFDLAYRRYTDIELALAQAKEARIEAALERVRSRSMGMQKSDELKEVIRMVYEQFIHLNIGIEHTGFIMDYKEREDMHIWLADEHEIPSEITVPYFNSPHWNSFVHAKAKGLDFFSNQLSFDEKNKFYRELFELFPGTPVSEETKDYYFDCPGLAISTVLLDNVGLYIENFAGTPYADEENAILMRFGKVFQQTYTRFRDLQKAEAQARESQIQLALERVRARAMAMQNSNELADTVAIVFRELKKLDFVLTRCAIVIMNDAGTSGREWTAEIDQSVKSYLVNYADFPYQRSLLEAWKQRQTKWMYDLHGSEMYRLTQYLITQTEYVQIPAPVKEIMLNTPRILLSHSFANFGFFRADSLEPLSEENLDILNRFGTVFDMCYTRFNDLKQAEAQAKEAKIEAALERVRSRTMSMHNSHDVGETVAAMFDECTRLGVDKTVRCGVGIISENHHMEVWTAYADPDGKAGLIIGSLDMTSHPMLEGVFDCWKNKQTHSAYTLAGEDQKNYYRAINSSKEYHARFKLGTLPEKQYQNAFYFPEGFIYVFSHEQLDGEAIRVFKKFAGVFGLTYRRFLDLQRAETQAREATKQASVDRVRGEIASMRTATDLERITPLIWNELTILGVPFIRSGVFIVDEDAEVIHTYLSTPDGKALATFNLAFNSEGIAQNVLPAWGKKEFVTVHWSAEEFAGYTKSLVDRGAVQSQERYVTEHPDTSLDLHFFPFLQGMLYVGNVNPLAGNETDLVQSLADAFSTAYARYEDFNQLELAKEQVENTLTDLKDAQAKLIQSEKMASLGELTAGIAHEIQNPLNFVNNFSEVNREMLGELEEELLAGNIDDALAIAADIRQNEQKITHHGKRADAIVKGMLEHSRAGTGERLPTDINVLADEYLKLSYHGLRAKDKTFNAEMTLNFDSNLPKIELVQQDVGRLFINLFNNAFYAVNQKKKTAGAAYRPEVTVSTAMESGAILIRVKDNGTGMPEHIKDKIMQPFFTTKPTGEGTGLGLSLSYDIVTKGHGGKIEVKSIEGEESEFKVSLPVN